MSSANADQRKRKRFFGCDPSPECIFSLDTSRQAIPLNLLCREKTCFDVSPATRGSTCPSLSITGTGSSSPGLVTRAKDSGREVEASLSSPFNHDEVGRDISTDAAMVSASCEEDATSRTPDSPVVPGDDRTEGLRPNFSETQIDVVDHGDQQSDYLTPEHPSTPDRGKIVSPREARGMKQEHFDVGLVSSTEHEETLLGNQARVFSTTPAQRRQAAAPTPVTALTDVVETVDVPTTAGETLRAPTEGEHGCATITTTVPVAPFSNPDDHPQVSPVAAMIASFLRHGTASQTKTSAASARASRSLAAYSPGEKQCGSSTGRHIPRSARSALSDGVSPPSTPTHLASLVTGVPPGSGGGSLGVSPVFTPGEQGKARSPAALAWSNVTQGVRSAEGGSRFFNAEWSPRLKERRRVVRFPKRSDPPGSRILYWVRGNFRVRDNLALSAAMWLSTKLRMPLQVLTFVDPEIGRAAPTRPRSVSRATDRGHVQEDARQELPFRMAVEASALCEMEHELRTLNVPLAAIACAESEIPTALARWCAAADGSDPGTAGTPAVGRVHLAIADESYHPRQLWLAERAKEALVGVAFYTVDTSCVCPVNTFRGGRGTAPMTPTAVTTTGASKVFSREDFRKAQTDVVSIALEDLAPRPRLPLNAQLQRTVLTDNGVKLPGGFETLSDGASILSAIVLIEWAELRRLTARRFPRFGKPATVDASPSREDLIAAMGGGESVGETCLQRALRIAATSLTRSPDRAAPAGKRGEECSIVGLVSAADGVGFDGCLLHLLRLGSLSSIRVVKALLDRATELSAGTSCFAEGLQNNKGLSSLLEAVLKREYALYRAFCYYQREGRLRTVVVGAIAPHEGLISAHRPWRASDWMGMLPAWVWEELRRGQLDARQHPHSPAEIRSAGSTVPSSVQDAHFSAIQASLTDKARLHPVVAPYWARAVVKMLLIPSQAITLLVDIADELCLGARYAGDVVSDLLASAFDAFEEGPVNTIAAVSPLYDGGRAELSTSASSSRELPIFRRLSDSPLATRAGLESALIWGTLGKEAASR